MSSRRRRRPGTYHSVDTKDRANVHTSIDIATAIKRVEDDAILSSVFFLDDDCIVKLLGHKNCRLSRCTKSIDHNIIGEHVQLLLFFTLHVRFTCQTYTDPMSDRHDREVKKHTD